MRKLLSTLALLAALVSGAPAHADFVTGNTTLPSTKTDLQARPATIPAVYWFGAADYNALMNAALDLRNAVVNGAYLGLSALTGDPLPGNSTSYFWLKTDHSLHFKTNSVDNVVPMCTPSASGDVCSWNTGTSTWKVAKTSSVINITDSAYGGVGDGSTNDGPALQAAVNAVNASGQTVLLPAPGNFRINTSVNINKPLTLLIEDGATLTVGTTTIGIAADNVTLMGRGSSSKIVQGVISNNLFSGSSHSGLQVHDIAFTGVASTTISSSNSAFLLTSFTNVSVHDNTFTNFTHYPVWTKGSSEVSIVDNTFIGNMAWLAAGGSHLNYSRNLARDPQFPNTTFFIPLQFDSTSGGFGVASDITVENNQFINWPSSQCILLHTGNKAVVSGNLLDNCYIGISANTFQAGDITNDVVISDNTVIGSTTSGLSTTIANIPITLGGAAAAPMQHFVITGNHMLNGNTYTSNDNWGCLNLAGNLSDVLVEGNTFDTCAGNGIAMNGTNARVTIIGNHMHNFVASAGGQKVGVGVWNTTGQSGYIANNDIDGAAFGIRLDVASNMVIGSNNMTNVATARILNPGNGQINSLEDGFRRDNIGTTNGASAVSMSFQNLTAAANGAQQSSPLVEWVGQGWDSTASASKTVKCMWQLQPVQAAGNPTGLYLLMCSSNGASYSEVARHTTGGSFFLPPNGNFDLTGSGTIGFATANATTVGLGNSAVTAINVAGATINIGTGTNTTTNLSKVGAQVNVIGRLQLGMPMNVGSNIASATTIGPTSPITHITGTTTIQTITAPGNWVATSTGGCLVLIFDGVAPWNAAGNILVAGTPTTAGTTVQFCYDNGTAKWYPSRTL